MTDYKRLVVETLGGAYGKVAVRRGRGTSQAWIYISTELKVRPEHVVATEKALLDAGHCGIYYDDCQPASNHAFVLWAHGERS